MLQENASLEIYDKTFHMALFEIIEVSTELTNKFDEIDYYLCVDYKILINNS